MVGGRLVEVVVGGRVAFGPPDERLLDAIEDAVLRR